MKITLYYHKDFDGICSAAVFASYVRSALDSDAVFEFVAVDYDQKKTWANKRFSEVTAIVDFLYHPDAKWWFDHHPTTFVRKDWELLYKRDAQHVWSPEYKSCPRLIVDAIENVSIRHKLQSQFSEALYWCDVIDSATYASPQQVIDCAEAALQINATLIRGVTVEYLNFLVGCLERSSLSVVAELEPVRQRFQSSREWQDAAISYVRERGHVSKGVGFIDFSPHSDLFHRYAAYYLWPDIEFQVALYRRSGFYRLTVAANPWLRSDGPNLGALCERYKGGGHHAVGGVIFSSRKQAVRSACEILRILRKEVPFHEQLSLRPAVSDETVTGKTER